MRHSKRDILTTQDVNNALNVRNVEVDRTKKIYTNKMHEKILYNYFLIAYIWCLSSKSIKV